MNKPDLHITPIQEPTAKEFSTLRAWTDYPIAELGDAPGVLAPVRECMPIHYDNDKYAKVVVQGVTVEFKAGYLYAQPGRLGEVPQLNPDLINQWRWVRDCPCGNRAGDACRSPACHQLKDRYTNA